MITTKINPAIFWANVKELRLDKDWTQAYVAGKLGIDPKSYSCKELGRQNRVLRSFAVKVAEIFETTVEILSAGKIEEAPPHPFAVFFEKVRERRELMGISQGVMAERLGMSRTNWNAKEQCKISKHPGNTLIVKIAEVLQCTVDELMGVKDKDFNIRRGIAVKLIEWYKGNPSKYREYIERAVTDGVISEDGKGEFVLAEEYMEPAAVQDQGKVDAIVDRMSKLMEG